MNTLNILQVGGVLRTIARVSLENEKYFCDLDAETGDADFGKSIGDGFRAVLAELSSIDRTDIGSFLIKVGSIFASHAGGTSGPIWGTAFLRAGLKAKGKTADHSRRCANGSVQHSRNDGPCRRATRR